MYKLKIKTKLKKIYTYIKELSRNQSNKKSHILKNKFIDKKLIIGTAIGITIAAGTSVFAEVKPNGMLASISNFFGINKSNSDNPTVSAVSTQLSVEAQKCAAGAEGTLGAAIKNAAKIHLEIAAVAPPVEELFDGDCFSGLMSIFDLSFAIPSLASIMAAVTDAVIKFAQKQVCRAVKKASSMISDPINKAISKINSMQGLTDFNGFINGMVQQGLDGISSDLGTEYLAPKSAETITVEANAFKLSQASIENGTNQNSSSNNITVNNNNNIHYGNQVSGSLYTNMNALNMAQQAMAKNTQNIISITPAITQAQQRLNSCSSNNNVNGGGNGINCSQFEKEYQDLINQREQLELANLQIQNSITQGKYNVQSGINNSATVIIPEIYKNTEPPSSQKNGNSWFNFSWLTN